MKDPSKEGYYGQEMLYMRKENRSRQQRQPFAQENKKDMEAEHTKSARGSGRHDKKDICLHSLPSFRQSEACYLSNRL
jgi:hypothetical protein